MGTEDNSKSFEIREWKEEDCEEIMSMIKELGSYEKMLDQILVTTEDLRDNGFGPRAILKCFVVEDLSQPEQPVKSCRRPLIGYALYFYSYSTFDGRCLYLEDIYVSEQHRNKGLGRALFKALANVAVEEHLRRIEFNVLTWNKSSIQFYEKLGAVNTKELEDFSSYRVEWSAIKQLANS